MAYVARDSIGEAIFDNEPIYYIESGEIIYEDIVNAQTFLYRYDTRIDLPEGTIKKIIGKELTVNDDPVKLKEK